MEEKSFDFQETQRIRIDGEEYVIIAILNFVPKRYILLNTKTKQELEVVGLKKK